ncbi:hypothetical protein [Rhodocyclus tenuis]|uniref:Uncharacterized protein n=1 Tax=Rhodocyclus tenuis TaxID=1066 RepID=A0A840G5V3_RHOTE|nr:hypothetical protein [Rhodocyclus tenuis]MBB4247286.1 hypothetical protein [Rhodocyclus tenuis]
MNEQKWVMVPSEPTPEIIAGAAIAAWPKASAADIAIAKNAAKIVLMSMASPVGVTLDMLAATLATMAPAYRAMIAAAPKQPAQKPPNGFDEWFNSVEAGDGDIPLPTPSEGKRWDEYVGRRQTALAAWIAATRAEQVSRAVDKAWDRFQSAVKPVAQEPSALAAVEAPHAP